MIRFSITFFLKIKTKTKRKLPNFLLVNSTGYVLIPYFCPPLLSIAPPFFLLSSTSPQHALKKGASREKNGKTNNTFKNNKNITVQKSVLVSLKIKEKK